MLKKQFIIILITYFIATFIRAFTGVFFNPFFDKFDLILLIKDFTIWALSYILVTIIVSKLTKQKSS